MSFQEKDFQTIFNKWCKHFINSTAVFELKITRGGSLSFDSVKDHQSSALYAAVKNKVVWKIPDAGYQNPFDSFVITGASAFVVIMFHAKHDNFYIIPIEKWLHEADNSSRKSITEEKAKEIGVPCSLKLGILNKDRLNLEQKKSFKFNPNDPSEDYSAVNRSLPVQR